MKNVEVEIKGDKLLMSSPHKMLEEQDLVKSSRTTKKASPKEDAENSVYKMETGELFIPAAAVKGCMRDASSYKKVGRYALKPILSGNVRISPEEIGLGTKKYEIDRRTVVNQLKGRVLSHRPLIRNWKAKFTMAYDEEIFQDPVILKQVLEDAGKRVGILAFRPSNGGEFGTFKVTKFVAKR